MIVLLGEMGRLGCVQHVLRNTAVIVVEPSVLFLMAVDDFYERRHCCHGYGSFCCGSAIPILCILPLFTDVLMYGFRQLTDLHVERINHVILYISCNLLHTCIPLSPDVYRLALE